MKESSNNIRFSCAIPVHNGGKFLAAAIRSALAQDRPFDEVIIVDDASTDNSKSIIQSAEFFGRVTYYYNPVATGFVDAWNRAAKFASGDFVTILHQDDLLHPSYLKVIEAALDRYPHVQHLYTSCFYIDADGVVVDRPPYPHNFEPQLYSGNEYAARYLQGVVANQHIYRCPGVTTSRRLMTEQCVYRKEAGHIADDDFFYRIGEYTDVVGISMPLASFREHSASETGKHQSLTLALARDYLFQMRAWRVERVASVGDYILTIDQMAARFIFELLLLSSYKKNNEWFETALGYRREFEDIASRSMTEYLPIWRSMSCRLITTTHGSRFIIFWFSLAADLYFDIVKIQEALTNRLPNFFLHCKAIAKMVLRSIVTVLLRHGKTLNVSSQSALFVIPHPDDEILGCAGLIALKRKQGAKVTLLMLTDGEESHFGCCSVMPQEVGRARRKLALAAGKILGLSSDDFIFCAIPDMQIPGHNDPEFLAKVEELSAIVAKLQPAEIYAPVPFDKWHDHEMAYEIAEQISKRMSASTRLYGYAIWMWWNASISDFSRIRRWNRFRLNIRLVREMKLRAIDTYLTDVAPTCGISWCGKLPKNFLRIFKQDNEIFFERRE